MTVHNYVNMCRTKYSHKPVSQKAWKTHSCTPILGLSYEWLMLNLVKIQINTNSYQCTNAPTKTPMHIDLWYIHLLVWIMKHSILRKSALCGLHPDHGCGHNKTSHMIIASPWHFVYSNRALQIQCMWLMFTSIPLYLFSMKSKTH